MTTDIFDKLKTPTIITKLERLGHCLEVIIKPLQSLLSLIMLLLHDHGDVRLDVKGSDYQRAIVRCRRDLNNEKTVGRFNEVATFIEDSAVDIEMCCLIKDSVVLFLHRWETGKLLIAPFGVVRTKCHLSDFFVDHGFRTHLR